MVIEEAFNLFPLVRGPGFFQFTNVPFRQPIHAAMNQPDLGSFAADW
jgi:hypothetical protein